MSYSNLTHKELLELQKKYQSGQIKEEEIPENQLQDLKQLYKNQIDILENSIKEDRQKILKIKKRLMSKNNAF